MNRNELKPGVALEPFEDRIDMLFKEIELAIQWQRPSILLAIYGSEYVYADAAAALENQLRNAGRQVEHIRGRNGAPLNIVQAIGAADDLDDTVFFVNGLRWASRGDSWDAYRSLNQSRDFFVAHRIRIVFWLTEDEASSLARYAPDYWAFRHRVVEFIESPEPEQILLRALQSTWQIAGEDTETYEDPDGKIALRYAMLEELPSNAESTGMRANLLLSLGILHWRKGILDKSMRLLQEALSIAAAIDEPWLQAACYNAIAIVQADQGLIDEAIESYQRAIALTPNEIFPWNNLGNLYERLNRFDEAIHAFEQALANNERDAMAWNGLGNVYIKQHRIADAIAAYNKAITISPDFAYPWNGLGNAFASMGDYDAAIGAYQAAVELNKDFPTPWVNLGNIFQEQGNNADALKAFWNAVRIDSKNAQIWNALGNAYFFSGQYEEAIQAYLKAIKLNRGQEVSYRNLAVAYARLGRHEEAQACYQKSLELGQEHAPEPQETTGMQYPANHTYLELEIADIPETTDPDLSEQDLEEIASDPAEEHLANILTTLHSEIAPQASVSLLPERDTLSPEADLGDIADSLREDPQTEQTSQSLTRFAAAYPLENFHDAPYQDASLDEMLESYALTPAAASESLTAPAESAYPFAAPAPASAAAPKVEAPVAEAASAHPLPESAPASAYPLPESAPASAHPLPESVPASAHPLPESVPASAYPLPESVPASAAAPKVEAPAAEATSAYPLPESVPASAHPLPESAPASAAKEAASAYTFTQSTHPSASDPGADLTTSCVHAVDDDLIADTEPLSRDALVWNELGNIYFNLGEYDEAIKAYQRAIELDPSFGWGYSNLALCYALTGRIAQARPLYEKIINLLESNDGTKLSWHATGNNRRPDYNDYGSLRRIAEALTARIEPQPQSVRQINIDAIYTQPYQSRLQINIDDLVESVREFGIIQPLIVTPNGTPGKYLLVAGERRLEAARRAGLTTVPAIVRQASERERTQLAIIENIQRVPLTPLELAEAYLRLSQEFHLSHEEIAACVGKPIETVTATLSLLKLSDKAKQALLENRITEAHARALLSLSTALAQNVILQHILTENLTVDQTEELVRNSVSRKTAYLPEDFDPEPFDAPIQWTSSVSQDEPRHAHLVARARSVLQSNPPVMTGARGYVSRRAK